MNVTNFFAGVVIIAVGLVLLLAGPQLIMIPSTQTQVSGLFENETFVVGDTWERSMQLDEGILVNGTLTVSSALTDEPSRISMLVVDDSNYRKWAAHGSPTYTFQREVGTGEGFSFSVPRSDLYHVVFDNAASPVKKRVVVSLDLQKQVVVSLPDERIRYLAYGLVVIGAVVTTVGILRRTEVPWT